MEQQEITQKVMIIQKCGCPFDHESSSFSCPGPLTGEFQCPDKQ